MVVVSTNKLKEHHKNGYYFTDVEGEKYDEIRRSIEQNGIRDPIKITMDYTVISGHQRLRIARDLGMKEVPVVMIPDLNEQEAEYLLIAENVERRGQAETDPIKKSRIANFLREYWGVRHGMNRHTMSGQNVQSKTTADIAETIGESEKTTRRILKLHDLIPELQDLVSEGKLGTTAGEQLAHLTEDNQRALLDVLGEEIEKTTVAKAKEYRSESNSQKDKDGFVNKIKQLQQENENLKRELDNKSEAIKEVVIEKEVIPDYIKNKISELESRVKMDEDGKRKLQKMIGDLEEEKQRLQETLNSDEYKLNEKRKKEEALKSEAHISMFETQIIIQKFIKEFTPTMYLQGAMAYADMSVRKEMMESVKALEDCVKTLKEMLQAEKADGNNGFSEENFIGIQ